MQPNSVAYGPKTAQLFDGANGQFFDGKRVNGNEVEVLQGEPGEQAKYRRGRGDLHRLFYGETDSEPEKRAESQLAA